MYEVVLFFHKKCPKNKPQNRQTKKEHDAKDHYKNTIVGKSGNCLMNSLLNAIK